MNYWHKFSKHFTIKVALPHLLFGVIAAAFSLSAQSSIPVNQQPTNIIAITAVMVNLYEHQSDNHIQTVCVVNTKQKVSQQVTSVSIDYSDASPVIRLTPYNGIRAGPTYLA